MRLAQDANQTAAAAAAAASAAASLAPASPPGGGGLSSAAQNVETDAGVVDAARVAWQNNITAIAIAALIASLLLLCFCCAFLYNTRTRREKQRSIDAAQAVMTMRRAGANGTPYRTPQKLKGQLGGGGGGDGDGACAAFDIDTTSALALPPGSGGIGCSTPLQIEMHSMESTDTRLVPTLLGSNR